MTRLKIRFLRLRVSPRIRRRGKLLRNRPPRILQGMASVLVREVGLEEAVLESVVVESVVVARSAGAVRLAGAGQAEVLLEDQEAVRE